MDKNNLYASLSLPDDDVWGFETLTNSSRVKWNIAVDIAADSADEIEFDFSKVKVWPQFELRELVSAKSSFGSTDAVIHRLVFRSLSDGFIHFLLPLEGNLKFDKLLTKIMAMVNKEALITMPQEMGLDFSCNLLLVKKVNGGF